VVFLPQIPINFPLTSVTRPFQSETDDHSKGRYLVKGNPSTGS